MTVTIENTTREQVAVFLPKAIQKALDSYHQFVDKETPEDTDKFSKHHTACKVAIAHLNLLLDLAKWADLELGEELLLQISEGKSGRQRRQSEK